MKPAATRGGEIDSTEWLEHGIRAEHRQLVNRRKNTTANNDEFALPAAA